MTFSRLGQFTMRIPRGRWLLWGLRRQTTEAWSFIVSRAEAKATAQRYTTLVTNNSIILTFGIFLSTLHFCESIKMKFSILILLIALTSCYARRDRTELIVKNLNNERLVRKYFDCVLERRRCDLMGLELKGIYCWKKI